MNEVRVGYLLEALKLANHPEDYKFREDVRRELAHELNLNPLAIGCDPKRQEVLEEHFDRVCDEKENLKEAIRLISESF